MNTTVFWIAIVVVLLFILFLCRKYLGRILIILISLSMIGGIFFLINPQGAMNLWNSVQGSSNLENGDKNPEEYYGLPLFLGKRILKLQQLKPAQEAKKHLVEQ